MSTGRFEGSTMIQPMLRSAVARSGFLVLLATTSLPAVAGQDHITLPGDRAYPESVTSTADGTLYAGSFAAGGIVRVPASGAAAQIWISPGGFDTRSTLGVLA